MILYFLVKQQSVNEKSEILCDSTVSYSNRRSQHHLTSVLRRGLCTAPGDCRQRKHTHSHHGGGCVSQLHAIESSFSNETLPPSLSLVLLGICETVDVKMSNGSERVQTDQERPQIALQRAPTYDRPTIAKILHFDPQDQASILSLFPCQKDNEDQTDVPLHIRGFDTDYRNVFKKIEHFRKMTLTERQDEIRQGRALQRFEKELFRS